MLTHSYTTVKIIVIGTLLCVLYTYQPMLLPIFVIVLYNQITKSIRPMFLAARHLQWIMAKNIIILLQQPGIITWYVRQFVLDTKLHKRTYKDIANMAYEHGIVNVYEYCTAKIENPNTLRCECCTDTATRYFEIFDKVLLENNALFVRNMLTQQYVNFDDILSQYYRHDLVYNYVSKESMLSRLFYMLCQNDNGWRDITRKILEIFILELSEN